LHSLFYFTLEFCRDPIVVLEPVKNGICFDLLALEFVLEELVETFVLVEGLDAVLLALKLLVSAGGVVHIHHHVFLLLGLLQLQLVQLGFDVGVEEVRNVHAVHELGHFVEVPVGILQLEVLLRGDEEHSRTPQLLLQVLGCHHLALLHGV